MIVEAFYVSELTDKLYLVCILGTIYSTWPYLLPGYRCSCILLINDQIEIVRDAEILYPT